MNSSKSPKSMSLGLPNQKPIKSTTGVKTAVTQSAYNKTVMTGHLFLANHVTTASSPRIPKMGAQILSIRRRSCHTVILTRVFRS